MKRLGFVAVVMLWGQAALAAEPVEDLPARSKRLAASVEARVAHSNAPFRAASDPIPGLLQREDVLMRKPAAACEAHSRDLCYDLADRRIVYRPVRRYMPRLDGLTPESVSLRHDRLILKYSFR
jgi:hypothetical protein